MRSRHPRLLRYAATVVAGTAGPASARDASPSPGAFGTQAAAAGLDRVAARALQSQVDALILAGAYSSRVWYNSAGVSFVQPC